MDNVVKAPAAQKRQAVLDRSSSPKYLQVANTLRRRIRVGSYAATGMLPNIDALIAEFGVARMTILKALDDLTQSGLIRRESGRGTFVNTDSRPNDIIIGKDFEEGRDGAAARRTRLLVCKPHTGPLPDPFRGEDPREPLQFLRRLMSVSGHPYHVGDYYIPRSVYEMRPEEEWRADTVGRILARLPEFAPLQIRQTIQMDTADFALADTLHMKLNEPIFDVARFFVCKKSGRSICKAHLTFRADMVRFDSTVELSSEEELRSVRGHIRPME